MNKIDIVLLIILGFGLIRGFMRGLIIEMASLLAIVVGIYGAIHFSFFTASLLEKVIPAERSTIETVAFGLTLIVLMLAVMFLAKIITQMFKAAQLGFLNRLTGGIFGMVKSAVIVGALFVFLERTFQVEKWLSTSALSESLLYKPVKSISEVVYANVFPDKEKGKGEAKEEAKEEIKDVKEEIKPE